MSVKLDHHGNAEAPEVQVNKVVKEVTGDYDESEVHGISVSGGAAEKLDTYDHKLMTVISSLLVYVT